MTVSRTSLRVAPLLLTVAALVAGCQPQGNTTAPAPSMTQGAHAVTGTATYRERILPPPGSTLRVQLLDNLLADTPNAVIADAMVKDVGGPPIAFTLPFDPAKLGPNGQYGLHATFKPPFRLAGDRTVDELDAALRRFAQQQHAFTIEAALQTLRGFLAWRLRHGDPARDTLHAFADACVAEFDAFRAPPPPAELARRRRAGLSDAQERHLERWGYPYVFGTFTFHITLTGRLDHAEQLACYRALEASRVVLPAAMPIDHIALFSQAAPDAPFNVARVYRFDGSVEDFDAAQSALSA